MVGSAGDPDCMPDARTPESSRTIAEADGAIKYANPARAMAQLERDARLRAAGFEVVHFTWADITRSPAQVAASIKAAFQRGALRGQVRRLPVDMRSSQASTTRAAMDASAALPHDRGS